MKVYKFGGASVKDVGGIQNVAHVLRETQFENGVIVVSAMGKTTNALEVLVRDYMDEKEYETDLNTIEKFHFDMVAQLFPGDDVVYNQVKERFDNLRNFLKYNKSQEYNFVYDQIVSFGELFSTIIVSAYLNENGIATRWLDSREYIKTDSYYREGRVNWELTQSKIDRLEKEGLYLTQGFIASDSNNFSVTLGREGSDYSAAIFAYCMNAESMTIWKDVPGVLNADPRYFPHPQLLTQISYQEAVEMAFYGASVIHPKTLKPLENKNIPFYVHSFLNPKNQGTKITKGAPIVPYVPCFIKKDNQHLLQISPKDFSFVSEYHMSEIFELLSKHKIKISLVQTSAISFNLCVEDKYDNVMRFLAEIERQFNVEISRDVQLFTIRHFTKASKKEILKGKEILLEQIVQETLQIVV